MCLPRQKHLIFSFFLFCVGGKQELGNQWELAGEDHLLSGAWNKLQLCSFTKWRETLFNFPARLYWHCRKCSWSSCSLSNRVTLKICKVTCVPLYYSYDTQNKCHNSEWNCYLLDLVHTCNLFFVEQCFAYNVVRPIIGSKALMGVDNTRDNVIMKRWMYSWFIWLLPGFDLLWTYGIN